MLAELYKILGSNEIKIQIAVLKFQSAYQCPNKHKVPGSSPSGVKWLLFSTLSLAVDKVIF